MDTGNNVGLTFVPTAFVKVRQAYFGLIPSAADKKKGRSRLSGTDSNPSFGKPDPDINDLCVTVQDLPQMPTMHMTFQGGAKLILPPKALFRFSGPKYTNGQCGRIRMQSMTSNNNMGQSLLRQYYTVFDREKNRLGFANLIGCQ